MQCSSLLQPASMKMSLRLLDCISTPCLCIIVNVMLACIWPGMPALECECILILVLVTAPGRQSSSGCAGLDSHAALSVIKYLISLTSLGHTVACSIHQPRQEIFNAFHKVVILSEGYQVRTAPLQIHGASIRTNMQIFCTIY